MAIRHGDPRHYPEDMDKLKVRIRQLEEENKDLQDALEAATAKGIDQDNWRLKGW